jgi:hypothetical protein
LRWSQNHFSDFFSDDDEVDDDDGDDDGDVGDDGDDDDGDDGDDVGGVGLGAENNKSIDRSFGDGGDVDECWFWFWFWKICSSPNYAKKEGVTSSLSLFLNNNKM